MEAKRRRAELKKHLLPERAQKAAWRTAGRREPRHALVGTLVSWVQPWTLGPRTDREESKAQGLRAKRAAEDQQSWQGAHPGR